ncbi:MAG TPA: hypothetical protein PKN29_07505 [Candidatus Ozemobacteraceae bacterium]|nr:hypothetical protein [Candidatus Ozemobacteraceae bacterium]
MIDMKVWLERNFASRNYDDPDVDPDLVAGRHKKAVANARSLLRQQLKQRLGEALDRGHAEELAVREEIAVRKKLFS